MFEDASDLTLSWIEVIPEISRCIILSCSFQDWPTLLCLSKTFRKIMDTPFISNSYRPCKYWKSVMICPDDNSNNLRMFDVSAFKNIRFENGRIASSKARGLLCTSSIVEELDQIHTENGVYLVTVNGCMRYKGGIEGEKWLEPWNPETVRTEIYEAVEEAEVEGISVHCTLHPGILIETCEPSDKVKEHGMYDDPSWVHFQMKKKVVSVNKSHLRKREIWKCNFENCGKVIYGLKEPEVPTPAVQEPQPEAEYNFL